LPSSPALGGKHVIYGNLLATENPLCGGQVLGDRK